MGGKYPVSDEFMHPQSSLQFCCLSYTRHSPWFGEFVCGAMTDNELTEKCRKIFPN